MRDEPDAELRSPTGRSSDPTKGVDSYRQQGGGHGSRNPLSTSVTTNLPNGLALKMDGAEAVCARLGEGVWGASTSSVGGRGGVFRGGAATPLVEPVTKAGPRGPLEPTPSADLGGSSNDSCGNQEDWGGRRVPWETQCVTGESILKSRRKP